METKTLTDELFWNWVANNGSMSDRGINAYLRTIACNQLDTGYIVELMHEYDYREPSKIMENLSFCIPRWYFLEIQFCAKMYATVFGKVFPPLVSQVDQLAYIEWLLYTEPSSLRYRDHLVHMFKVAFVGDQLLAIRKLLSRISSWQFSSSHFISWCKERKILIGKWKSNDKEEVLKIAFFLAALFHDFGYGYFFLTKYKERLFKLYPWLLPRADPTDTNTSSTRMLLQSLPSLFIRKHHAWLNGMISDNMDIVLAGFYRDCLPLNHSIASTFFVVDVAEKLLTSGALTPKLYVAFHLAAEACMIHDMINKDTWVHLLKKENEHFMDCNDHQSVPLAMLLILADELSVWSRPSLIIEQSQEGVVSYRLDKSRVPSKIKISVTERNKQNEIKIVPDQAHGLIEERFLRELKCLKYKSNDKRAKIFDYSINISSPY